MTVRTPTRRFAIALVAAGSAGLLAAACAPTNSTGTGASTSTSAAPSAAASVTAIGPATASAGVSATATATATASATCSPSSIRTLTPDHLTFATSEPAYEPWMVDDKPTNGKGFESAVAYAAAEKLGYQQSQVSWVRVNFNAAIAPGAKSFDADINQFTITAAREKVVDFSAPYYTAAQAIVYLTEDAKAAAAAKAGTIAALRRLHLGAQVGTTSYDAITTQIKPTSAPGVYPSNDNAVQGLKAGQIDALVVDLPTALYLTSAELDGAAIAGQLPATTTDSGQFGFLLAKGSPVTACLSQALVSLTADGTLAALQRRWLNRSAGAPVLH
jgi:polar amino acid transport system substrate-binding protein